MHVIPTRPDHEADAGSVKVGSRWSPRHVIRRDTETGFYEELNEPTETQVQVALLRKPSAGRVAGWLIWAGLFAVALAAAAALK